jgi:hypothetical protein
MATAPRTAEERQANAEKLAAEAAVVTASLYASLLNVPIPENTRDVIWFTPDQAFELTRTLLYETPKDRELR